MKVYLAGPLFTLAERQFNRQLADAIARLCPKLDVFLPQVCDDELAQSDDFCQKVYTCLMEALERSDVVVALLDGPDADSGTCIEIGYAKGLGKRVIGVRTDFRGCQDQGLNLMVSKICCHLIHEPSTSVSLEQLAQRIVATLLAAS